MARKRKTNNPLKVYKYAVIDAEIPQSMWDVAKKMNGLWCELSKLHESARNQAKALYDLGHDKKYVKKFVWIDYEIAANKLINDSGLNSDCREEVRSRFDAACVKARKCNETGYPKPHGLRSICIPMHYGSGGSLLSRLSSSQSRCYKFQKSLELKSVNDGVFSVGEDKIHFTSAIHRPILDCEKVKRVVWLGTRDIFGWHWSISLTVEIPHPTRIKTKRSCAIDLGWRRIGDKIRTGFLVDTDANYQELSLALDFSNRSTKRFNSHFKERHLPQSWDDLDNWKSESDKLVNNLRVIVKNELGLPYADKLGYTGLIRLLRQDDLSDDLRRQIETVRERWETYNAASQRFTNRREHIYRNYANQIAQKYDKIVIEKSLGIKEMIESKDARANRNHQRAATYDLKLAIIQAAKKYGAEIIELDAAGTTSQHWDTGHLVHPDCSKDELYLTYQNGVIEDRDFNAACNLLKKSQLVRSKQQIQKLRIRSRELVTQALDMKEVA